MRLKKSIRITIGAAFLMATTSCALQTPPTQREQATGIGALGGGAAGAIIGSVTGSALAGGLIGLPLGALAGYYYGDKLMPPKNEDRVALETDKRARVTFSDVLFESDSAQIKRDATPYLNPLISYLNDNPARKVWIEGHTDSIGTAAHNLDLSMRRAEAVRDILVTTGVDSERIAVKGIGQSKPIASNDTEDGRRLNRRVEIEVF
jgi:outer membrane protein OmpA-like peptidoglycan-associated protein